MNKKITTKPGTGSAWADPGFLDRGFKFTKWGFDLFSLPEHLSMFLDFSESSP